MKRVVTFCILLAALCCLTAYASQTPSQAVKVNLGATQASQPALQKGVNTPFDLQVKKGQIDAAKVQAPTSADKSVELASPLKTEYEAVLAQIAELQAQGGDFSALKQQAGELYRQIYGSQAPARGLDQGGDVCASATVISSLPYCDTGTTLGYTDDYNPGNCMFSQGAPDVVYVYTPATTVTVTISLCGSFYDTGLGVYDACSPTANNIACNDDWCGLQSCVTATLQGGGTYYIIVDGFASDAGDYRLNITTDGTCGSGPCGPQAPANDDCANAMHVAIPSSTTGSTVSATADAAPNCGTSVDAAGVWYHVIGDGTTLTATTCNNNGTNYDSKLHVYTCGCDNLTCVTGNDDCGGTPNFLASTATWCSRAGEPYWILVEGFGGSTGNFQLDVTSDGVACDGGARCPCGDATLLAPGSLNGTTIGEDADCDAVAPGYPDYTVAVTIPTAGQWNFSLCGSDYDTYLGIGYDCCDFSICFNDDNDCNGQFTFQSSCCVDIPAGTYYVWISGFAAQSGNFVLTVAPCGGGGGCVVECPAGATLEGESCESDINGGCNSTPPAFSPIHCGETVCGMAYAANGTRDTDWYELVLTHPDSVIWCVRAEFPVFPVIVVAGPNGCDFTDYFYNSGEPCQVTCVAACLPAGTYYLFVATQAFDGVPCSDYVAHVECLPCGSGGGCNPTPVVQMSTTPVPQYQCADLCPGTTTALVICGADANPARPPIVTITPGCNPQTSRCDVTCDPAEFLYDPAGWYYGTDGCWHNVVIGLLPGCVCVSLEGFLGVEFNHDFTAVASDGEVALSWSTASESNNARFDILRNGATVGQVPASNVTTGHAYTWTDRQVQNGTSYSYTLVSVDVNGNREELATTNALPSFGAALISEYALHQNYPNPFNPETNITFDLVEAGNVTLSVYNLMGQEVAAVVHGQLASGRHTISFNATNLPSGVYVYKLNVNGFVAEKKMLLMK